VHTGDGRHQVIWMALALVLIGLVLVLSVVFLVPVLIVSPAAIQDTAARLKLQNDVRATMLQALGGMLFLTTAYFAWHQLQVSRRQLESRVDELRETTEHNNRQLQVAVEQQMTERFAKAIDQLGSDVLQVRLGALHSLGRLAVNSPTDREAIAALLEAYIADKAPWQSSRDKSADPINQVGTFFDALTSEAQLGAKALGHLLLRRRAPDVQLALTEIRR
jgi:TolA-binding protein